MKSQMTTAALVVFLTIAHAAVAKADGDPVYRLRLAGGLDRRVMAQGPRPDSITVADDPAGESGKVLRFSLSRDDDYSHVANGVPRAEISFASAFRLRQGTRYRIRWSVFLP